MYCVPQTNKHVEHAQKSVWPKYDLTAREFQKHRIEGCGRIMVTIISLCSYSVRNILMVPQLKNENLFKNNIKGGSLANRFKWIPSIRCLMEESIEVFVRVENERDIGVVSLMEW